MQTIEHIEKQKATYVANLQLLRDSIDEAAQAGDLEAVAKLQADLTATQALIESCDRRIAKAKREATQAEKDTIKAKNVAVAALAAKTTRQDAKLAAGVQQALVGLFDEIRKLTANGKETQAAVSGLVRQLPQAIRGDYRELAQAFSPANTLSFLLDDEMRRADVFNQTAARHPYEPKLVAHFKKRAENLPKAIQRLAEMVNAEC